jgi:hypothetical protein
MRRRPSALAGEALGRAEADLVRAQTGFAIGGVAPVGHLTPIRAWFDPRLLDFDGGLGRRGHAAARLSDRAGRSPAHLGRAGRRFRGLIRWSCKKDSLRLLQGPDPAHISAM